MKKPGIVVRVDLTHSDWKAEAGGKGQWRCAALRLPGARFIGLVGAGGREVDQLWYERRGRSIVWKGGSNPPTLQAELRFASPFAARARTLVLLLVALVAGGVLAHVMGPTQVTEALHTRVDIEVFRSIIGG